MMTRGTLPLSTKSSCVLSDGLDWSVVDKVALDNVLKVLYKYWIKGFSVAILGKIKFLFRARLWEEMTWDTFSVQVQ